MSAPHQPPDPAGISVVIPAYDAAATIGAAVASVRAAVRFAAAKDHPLACEVVVVDDASSDGTAAAALAEAAPDCPVRVLRQEPNQGAGAARNLGAEAARHPLLCFLDADDLYRPEHLLVCALALARRPATDFVSTRFATSRPVDPSWIPAISAASALTLCIRRAAHRRLGGFPPLRHFEDVFYRRLADALLTGWYLGNETVVYVWSPGNSFDRQLAKFSMPADRYRPEAGDRPPPEVEALFARRLAAAKAAIGGDPA